MNAVVHKISLDIHDAASQVSISVKKGDNTRKIVAVLSENGKGIYAPENEVLLEECNYYVTKIK